jgi:threonine dehydratase
VLIAGQATVALEILEDLPDVVEVYVPIGGGGLISCIALAIKRQRPETHIYGVEPVQSNVMSEALHHLGPVVLPEVLTMADGLAAATTEGLNYPTVQQYVNDVLLVNEDAIRDAMLFLREKANVLVEPSVAASLVGLLAYSQTRKAQDHV